MKTNNKVAMMIVGIPIITTILSATILSSTSVSADNDSVVDEINITIPVSCTMTGTGMDSHNAEIQNGIYQNNIGTTTLHAFCNDNEGFAIYAAGYTGNEIGGTNSNKLVGTTASSNATIVSGIATTAGSPDISNWAMKLAISQDSGDTTSTNAFTIDSAPNVDLPSEAEQSATSASFSEYHVVPNEYVKVAHKNSMTDMIASTGGVKLTTTYAAYISKTQPADTYSGQVIYTLVHPASATPSIIIPPTSCTTPVPGLTYMQDLVNSNKTTILSNMTEDAEYYLADKRDDKTYCVAKLKDGNLWMTQNLDHDIVTDGSVIYDNTTTDLGWNGTGYSAASWTPASATKATSDTTWTTDSVGNTIPESYDPGELYWNGELYSGYQESCEAVGGTWDDSEYSCLNPDTTSPTGDSHYHLGNYYNWTAAVALNNSSMYTDENLDIDQSICPLGWTLPKSGYNSATSGSFQYLLQQYSWDGYTQTMPMASPIWSNAIRLSMSGVWSGSLGHVGEYGYLWSPVVRDSDYSFSIYAHSGYGAHPSFSDYRNNGFSIRCMSR